MKLPVYWANIASWRTKYSFCQENFQKANNTEAGVKVGREILNFNTWSTSDSDLYSKQIYSWVYFPNFLFIFVTNLIADKDYNQVYIEPSRQ